jgi:hypothetical protein
MTTPPPQKNVDKGRTELVVASSSEEQLVDQFVTACCAGRHTVTAMNLGHTAATMICLSLLLCCRFLFATPCCAAHISALS